jgi:hypothetical protein
MYVIEELSVVFAPSRLAEMDLRNVVQPLPGQPETRSISPLLMCLLNSFKNGFPWCVGVCALIESRMGSPVLSQLSCAISCLLHLL